MRFVFLAGLICAATAATADTTAVYHARNKSFPLEMTVEIANDGSARYQMSMGRTYGLILGGVDYFVEVGADGVLVDRLDDLITVQKEAMGELIPVHKGVETPADSKLVPIGTITINGRIGKAYGYMKGTGHSPAVLINPDPGPTMTTRNPTPSDVKAATATPVLVISDDPELAPIGKVLADQFGKAIAALSGMMGSTPDVATQMQAILKTGAPLAFAGVELQSVNHARIDPKRFGLPGKPETLDQIRQRLRALPPPPTAAPAKP